MCHRVPCNLESSSGHLACGAFGWRDIDDGRFYCGKEPHMENRLCVSLAISNESKSLKDASLVAE
jgi:hypothetical protein